MPRRARSEAIGINSKIEKLPNNVLKGRIQTVKNKIKEIQQRKKVAENNEEAIQKEIKAIAEENKKLQTENNNDEVRQQIQKNSEKSTEKWKEQQKATQAITTHTEQLEKEQGQLQALQALQDDLKKNLIKQREYLKHIDTTNASPVVQLEHQIALKEVENERLKIDVDHDNKMISDYAKQLIDNNTKEIKRLNSELEREKVVNPRDTFLKENKKQYQEVLGRIQSAYAAQDKLDRDIKKLYEKGRELHKKQQAKVQKNEIEKITRLEKELNTLSSQFEKKEEEFKKHAESIKTAKGQLREILNERKSVLERSLPERATEEELTINQLEDKADLRATEIQLLRLDVVYEDDYKEHIEKKEKEIETLDKKINDIDSQLRVFI